MNAFKRGKLIIGKIILLCTHLILYSEKMSTISIVPSMIVFMQYLILSVSYVKLMEHYLIIFLSSS